MPTLILWRHAKSDWSHAGLADHDRPLNARGMKDRHIMGAYIATHYKPELIICSTARRAQETLAAYPSAKPQQIVTIDTLYHAAPETLLSLACQYGSGYETLMLVGHNPGMEILADAMRLTAPDIAARFAGKFATCAVAKIHWTGPWQDINPANGAVLDYQAPKTLVEK